MPPRAKWQAVGEHLGHAVGESWPTGQQMDHAKDSPRGSGTRRTADLLHRHSDCGMVTDPWRVFQNSGTYSHNAGGGRSMRAILRTKFGGPEVLVIREIPEPEPKAGHAVIQVKAFGLNHAEL